MATQIGTKRISIQFESTGEGKLRYGRASCDCLGKPGVRYPQDLTVTTNDKYRVKYSGEYVVQQLDGSSQPAEMPYAILIWGQRGIYIHAWPGSPTIAGNGGRPTSGCIHLSQSDAPKVFNYVDTRTRITISYPW